MARELSIEVTANTSQADAALQATDQKLDHLAQSAQQADRPLSALEQHAPQLASQLAQMGQRIDAAQKSLKELGDASEKTATKKGLLTQATGELVGAVARFAAPAVVGAAVIKTMQWADGLGELSQSTHISIANLQRFENVGRNFGLSAQQIANGVLMMSDRIAGGDKSAVQALQALGISQRDFVAMNPDQAFLKLAKAISEVDNPMQRVALGKDVLGRSLVTLLPFLLAVNEQFDATSAVLDDKTIVSLGDASDAMDRLWHSGTVLLAEVVGPLAPAITQMADAMANAAQAGFPKMRTWFDDMIEKAMEFRVRLAEIQESWANWRPLPDFMYPLDRAMKGQPQAHGTDVGSAQWLRDELDAFRNQRRGPQRTGDVGLSPGLVNGRFAPGDNVIEGGFVGPAMAKDVAAAKKAAKEAEEKARQAWDDAFNFRQYQNEQALASHNTPMDWQMNPRSHPFPGWAPPDVLQRLTGDAATGVGAIDPWASAVYGGTTQNRPGASGGGFLNFLRTNPLANFGLSQMFSLLPGFRNMGSSFGGGLGSAIGGIGGVAKSLGGFASFLGPIGGLVGGLIGKLFGPSEADKTRDQRNSFVDQFGGMAELQRQAGEANFSLDKLFNTRKVKDFEAEVRRLNEALHAHAEEVARINQEWDQGNNEVGGYLERLSGMVGFLPEGTAAGLRGLGRLSPGNQALIDAIMGGGGINVEAMQGAAGRLGIGDVNGVLGGAFNNARIGANASSVTNDILSLLRGGGDIGGILSGSSGVISDLVVDARRFGTELPEQMRPWVEELQRTGQLVDENGDKLKSLAGINFGAPIVSEFDQIIAKINELIAKLGELPGAFSAAIPGGAGGTGLDVNHPMTGTVPVDTMPQVETVGVSRGGIILGPGRVRYFAKGGFAPKGTDTVPAMLTPGEMVLTPDQVAKINLFEKQVARNRDAWIAGLPSATDGQAQQNKINQEAIERWASPVVRAIQKQTKDLGGGKPGGSAFMGNGPGSALAAQQKINLAMGNGTGDPSVTAAKIAALGKGNGTDLLVAAAKINQVLGNGVDAKGAQVKLDNYATGQAKIEAILGKPKYFARGGLVHGDYGGFEPWRDGTDIVPAMLSPGEAVLTPEQTANFATIVDAIGTGANITTPSFGGTERAPQGDVLVVSVDGTRDVPTEKIVRIIEEKFPRMATTGRVRGTLDKLYQRKARR